MKSNGSHLLFGIKRGKNGKKHIHKNYFYFRIFLANCLFLSDLLFCLTRVWFFIDSAVYLLIKLYKLFHWRCMVHTFRILWKIEKRRRYFWSVLCMIFTIHFHFFSLHFFLLLRLIFLISFFYTFLRISLLRRVYDKKKLWRAT